jgi:hypothetical protein
LALRVVHTFGKNAGAARTLKQDVVGLGGAPDNSASAAPSWRMATVAATG